MNKEPIGLYIFRFILGLGLFAFMGMLYWSSLSIEDDLKSLRTDVSQLKNDLFNLRADTDKIRDDVLHTILEDEKNWQDVLREILQQSGKQPPDYTSPNSENPDQASKQKIASSLKQRPHIDPALPNLLREDPFYAVTLPKMLGKDFKPKGVFHGASVGRPNNLHPFSNWSQVSSWNDQCTVALTKMEFGKYETMAPDMAIKIEARPIKGKEVPEFWIHIRDEVYWEPLRADLFTENVHLAPQFLRKHKVTAHDFKFFMDAMMNPNVQEAGAVALRTYYDDIKEIEVIDDLTFIVRWKEHEVLDADGKKVSKIKYMAKFLTGSLRPLASFVYQYFPDGKKIIEDDAAPDTYRKNSVWAQNFSQHWAKNIIVSCGPWLFDGMTDREIRFKRNPNYYSSFSVLVEGAVVEFKESPDAIWQDFKINKLDSFNLQPDQVIELASFLKSEQYEQQAKKGDTINRLDYLARSYTYLGWNQAKPYFKSKKVRQALTMGIDRQRIVQQNMNGMAIQIACPFYRYSPSYDESIEPWPFDLQKARSLLEEEGWFDSDGDGIIDKMIDGKRVPFRFKLTYFVKNPVTKSICEYVSTALKELNIDCSLNGVDVADLSSAFDDKSFDAICLGWALGTPPEDPKQLWHSSGAKEKGSSNAVGFANAEADRIIDLLQYEYDEKERITLYHKFCAIIHEEAPYTLLFSPKTALLYRAYLQNVFIPADRQDLVPGANVAEPDSSIFWLKK